MSPPVGTVSANDPCTSQEGSALRFLHAADLHLDTAPTGLRDYPPVVAEVLRDASLRAFDRLVDTALSRRVDLCLFAGDVYDGAVRGTRAQLRFRDGLARLAEAGIRSFVVHGNHDPVEEGWTAVRSWPEGVTVFDPGRPTSVGFRAGDRPVVVHGVSYARREESDNLARRFERTPGDAFQIGLLHTNVGGRSQHRDYAPCSLEDLLTVGLDYWALGHVHVADVLHGPAPWVVYPGNLQGRHLGAAERGAKGAVIVEVGDDGAHPPEFVALDVVRFVHLQVPVDDLADLGDLQDVLRDRADGLLREHEGRPVVARVVLTGRGPLHHLLARDGTERLHTEFCSVDREPFVWFDRFEDRTLPDVDLAAARRADDFTGDVLRRLGALDAAEVELVVSQLPDAARRALGVDVAELTGRAQVLALDALSGGDR